MPTASANAVASLTADSLRTRMGAANLACSSALYGDPLTVVDDIDPPERTMRRPFADRAMRRPFVDRTMRRNT